MNGTSPFVNDAHPQTISPLRATRIALWGAYSGTARDIALGREALGRELKKAIDPLLTDKKQSVAPTPPRIAMTAINTDPADHGKTTTSASRAPNRPRGAMLDERGSQLSPAA